MTWKFFRLKPGLQGQQSRTGWRALGGGETHAARAPPSARGPSRSPGPPTAHSHDSGPRSPQRSRTQRPELWDTEERLQEVDTERSRQWESERKFLTSERPDCTRHRKSLDYPAHFCVLRPDLAPSRGKQGLERARCPGSGFASRKVATRGCRSLRPVLCYSHFIILLRGIEKFKRKRKVNLQKSLKEIEK